MRHRYLWAPIAFTLALSTAAWSVQNRVRYGDAACQFRTCRSSWTIRLARTAISAAISSLRPSMTPPCPKARWSTVS